MSWMSRECGDQIGCERGGKASMAQAVTLKRAPGQGQWEASYCKRAAVCFLGGFGSNDALA